MMPKLMMLPKAGMIVLVIHGAVGRPVAAQACPAGIPAGLLIRDEVPLRVPEKGEVGEAKELRREPSHDVLSDMAFYSVNRPSSPESDWLRFAIDSVGWAYRISGFLRLDLEALACRLKAEEMESAGDAWRALQRFAEALAPFQGATYLLGVSERGVQDHPESGRVLSDSTDFSWPTMDLSEERDAYVGAVTVMWSREGRVHIVEWSFALNRMGQLETLKERLLAGQIGLRELAYSRDD